MRSTVRITPTTSGARRTRRLRSLGGIVLGGTLLLGCAGARQLTDTEAVATRRGEDTLRALCSTPGASRIPCSTAAAGTPDDERRARVAQAATAPRAFRLAQDLTGWVFGVAAATLPTEAPSTTTAAPAPAPEAAPAPAPAPEPAAAEPAPEEQPEEEQPEETSPPTTRKPKKPATTAPAPAPNPGTEAPAPQPTPAPEPEETTAPTAAPSVRVDASLTGRFVALLNAQRAAAGLPAVSSNGALVSAAARHSKDQAVNHTMTHAGSDGSTVGSRCSAAGYAWRGLAENVAAGQGSADAAMNSWLNSGPHRANMMNPSYVHIGVAVAWASDGTPYWTMDLGAPA